MLNLLIFVSSSSSDSGNHRTHGEIDNGPSQRPEKNHNKNLYLPGSYDADEANNANDDDSTLPGHRRTNPRVITVVFGVSVSINALGSVSPSRRKG